MPHGFEGWCVTGHVSASSGLSTSLSRAPPHKQRGARRGEAICLVCEQRGLNRLPQLSRERKVLRSLRKVVSVPGDQVSITLHIALLNEQALKGPRRHHKNVSQAQKHKNITVLL